MDPFDYGLDYLGLDDLTSYIETESNFLGYGEDFTGANDRVPLVEEALYPDTYSDYTEEAPDEILQEWEQMYEEELGILSESELLRESPVYDDEMGAENLDNDFDSDWPTGSRDDE